MPPTKTGWQSSPQIRGTSDLLFSCATTLFLCAWTAYHPNVPTGRSKWARVGHRLVWMSIAIVVPEFVLWCAWEQWWAARKLRQQVNKILERGKEAGVNEEDWIERDTEQCHACAEVEETEAVVVEGQSQDSEMDDIRDTGAATVEVVEPNGEVVNQETPTPVSRPQSTSERLQDSSDSHTNTTVVPWTLSQSFFALSGGYAFPSPDPSHPPLTITAAGILLLLRLQLLPETSSSAISDKSKADGIAKALVCLQAGWFTVQIIARAIAKLPITTLEIHVLAHVLCAFAIYAVWFEKGYDVGEPIMVDSEIGKNLGALFALRGSDERAWNTQLKCACSSTRIDCEGVIPIAQSASRHSTPLYWGKVLNLFEIERKSKDSIPQADGKRDIKSTKEYQSQIERANCALRFLKSRGVHLGYGIQEFYDEQQVRRYIHVDRSFTVPMRSDLKVQGLDAVANESRRDFNEKQIGPFAVITTLYGSVHFSAMAPAHFPTRVEYYLWLGATITMVTIPFLFMINASHSLAQLSRKMEPSGTHNFAIKALKGVARALLTSCSMTLLMVMGILGSCYPFARAYILVESLVALRSVDERVYQTIQWTRWMPHVG